MTDGTWASYFRGRKLCGKAVKVPEGYEGQLLLLMRRAHLTSDPGIIACKTDRVMPENRKPPIRFRNYPNDDTDEEEDDPEEQSEPVKVLEAVGKFDEVLVWKQDNLPATDDPFVKGAEEWIVFANAVCHPSYDPHWLLIIVQIHGRDDKPKKR